MGSFNDPAVTPQAFGAVNTSPSDTNLDATPPTTRKVIPFVGMEHVGSMPCTTRQSFHGGQRVDQTFKDHRVMAVNTGHIERQRQPSPVHDEVSLTA